MDALSEIIRMMESYDKSDTFKTKSIINGKEYKVRCSIRFWNNFFTGKKGNNIHISLERAE